jgi:hypothetical protein
MTTTVRETAAGRRLGQEIKDSAALRGQSVPLAVLASVVCAVLSSSMDTGRTGTLLGAATGPLISALFTTQGRAKARGVGIVLVTLLAFTVTVTGFTVPELIRGGKSLIADRHGTFVPTGSDPRPSAVPVSGSPSPSPVVSGPAIEPAASSLACGDVTVGETGDCGRLDVRSTGTEELRLTGFEVEGASDGEFVVPEDCAGPLAPGGSCQIAVRFHPLAAGPRQAVLVIHQNLPGPATRVTLSGTGLPGDSTPPTDPLPSDPVPTPSP